MIVKLVCTSRREAILRHDDDEVDDLSDRDDPDPSDMDPDDEPEVMPCPYCGKMIHERTEWCHHCGKYLSEEDSPNAVPGWIMIGTVLGLVVVLTWFLAWAFG